MTEQTMTFCQIVLDRRWIKVVNNDAPPYEGSDPRNNHWAELRKSKGWDKKIEDHRASQVKRKPKDQLPFPFNDLDPQVSLPVTMDQPWHTQIHRDAISYGAVAPNIDKRTIVDLRFFGPVEPRKDNSITFTTDIKDVYGMPQPTFHFTLGDTDRGLSQRMMTHMQEVAGVLGGYLPGSEPQFMGPGLALHLCGTTRAGEAKVMTDSTTGNQELACCDAYSKVFDVDNLYLGGLDVIPGKNASNPTLTAMCFAIKSANEISDRLRKNEKERKKRLKVTLGKGPGREERADGANGV